MADFQSGVLNIFIHIKMLWIKLILWKPFIRQTHHPQAVQEELLKDIIAKNLNTKFGKEHHFGSIHSYQDYCKAVPVQTYEDLRPYIEEQESGSQAPIMYAQTSGTTGKPKYIPILPSTLSQYKKSQALYSYAQYLGIPSIYKGKVLAIVSPAIEGHLDTGLPFGSMSGLIYQGMPSMVRSKYIVPPEVFEIEDYNLKYFLIAAFSLKEKNITMLGSANPSTFFKIMDVITNDLENLLKFLSTADTSILNSQSQKVTSLIENHFKQNRKRAQKLENLIDSKESLTFGKLWPNLKAVVTWTGGSGSIHIPKLKSMLPDETRIVEMGYLASEFRGSITVDVINNKCVPTFHENFFEFVDMDSWESQNPKFLNLDQIETGKQYFVIATTQNGLFRYFINDIVEVTGRLNNTPCIRFVQKGKGVTNLTGEKLYESQVMRTLEAIKSEINAEFDFFIMLADPEEMQYTLYIECSPLNIALEEKIEDRLSQLNMEFDAKRKSGRLKPTKIIYLNQGTGEAYKAHCIENGQREGQFKLVRLQYSKDCSFDFSPFQHGST